MRAIRSCVVFGVASFVFAACSSGGAGSSCGAYFDKLVALLAQCGSTGLISSSQRDAFVAYCNEISTAPGVNNLSGQIDACTQSINTSVCQLPSCSLRGTFGGGTACANGAQCTSGDCPTSGTTNPTSELQCGTCAPLATQGGDCSATSGAICDTGLYCDSTSKCAPLVTQGGSCTSSTNCASGLVCSGGGSGTCVTPPSKGQACTTTCAAPYACISSVCADRVGAGGACPTGDECQSTLQCNFTTHVCEAIPIAKAGEACGLVNNQYTVCDSGLVCASGTCITPKQQGAACTVGNHECALNLVCSGGTCQVPDFSTCK